MFANGMVGISKEQTKSVNDIKVAVNNNLAAALLKEGKLTRVISCCTKVFIYFLSHVNLLMR